MISNKDVSIKKITEADKRLLAAIQTGLPLTPRPYDDIGKMIGMSEHEVIDRVQQLQLGGIIRRMGIIVHHRPLGYNANAMVVWNLPTTLVDEFGKKVSKLDFVTLCYQRKTDPDVWPYNLYTMIHGKDRESVMKRVNTLLSLSPVKDIDHQILFSSRRFKQQGARYFSSTSRAATAVAPELKPE
ncbi:MAG: Lrp/AsnC family transcriptional regulator [Gammaproteobacteria bacterium]|uniref:siroheme decarboxylase n=1 Tax=Candidatus Thiopontia autotrophica TaxID=2841688 RepID=A0A8J6NWN7_9GAMM|nr:Lrp/AsnC family transcriptional regulator [Candidatus Thiopontia autotrophica]